VIPSALQQLSAVLLTEGGPTAVSAQCVEATA